MGIKPSTLVAGKSFTNSAVPANLLKDGFGFKNNKIWAFYQFAVILQATATSDTVSMCMDFANDQPGDNCICCWNHPAKMDKTVHNLIITDCNVPQTHASITNNSNVYLQNMQSVCTSISESIMERNTLWASQQLSPL